MFKSTQRYAPYFHTHTIANLNFNITKDYDQMKSTKYHPVVELSRSWLEGIPSLLPLFHLGFFLPLVFKRAVQSSSRRYSPLLLLLSSSPPPPCCKATRTSTQDLLNVPSLEVSSVRVTTRLPMTLFKDMQKYGEGKISHQLSLFQLHSLTRVSHIIAPPDILVQESELMETQMNDLTTAYFSHVPSDVSIKVSLYE